MHSLKRLTPNFSLPSSSSLRKVILQRCNLSTKSKPKSTGDDEWNDAWESAWLPHDDDDPNSSSSVPTWDAAADVTLPSASDVTVNSSEIDADTKAFVAEMDERWNERRAVKKASAMVTSSSSSKKRDGVDEYRVRKQRIHAGLWMREIEKMEEAKLGNATADDIDRLLDSCSE